MEKLERLGLTTILDLMVHLPIRYEDRTRVTPIGSARSGDSVVLQGKVVASDIVFGRRRSLIAILEDGSGRITLRFFHFSKQQQQALKDATIRCYGEVRKGASGLELYHPEYSKPDTELPST